MTLCASLGSALGPLTTNVSQSAETLSSKAQTSFPQRDVSCFQRLPADLVLRIFLEVIGSNNCKVTWIGVLSSVCSRWHRICQHTVMWEFVAKHIFVAYPLVQALHRVPIRDSDRELMNCLRPFLGSERLIAETDDTEPPIAPTSKSLRGAMDSVRRYLERRAYCDYVQTRRVFVLHTLFSLALLCFSLFLGTTVCTAEAVAFGRVCSINTSFFLLWLTYLTVNATLIANTIIPTHFEPEPLLCRLRKNKSLIVRSIIAMVVGIVDIAIPALLAQLNFSRVNRFSWFWCGAVPIFSLFLWQFYVVHSSIVPEAKRQLFNRQARIQPKAVIRFLVLNFPNSFPFLMAGTIFCVLYYAEYGDHVYMLIGTIPITTSLSILTLLFLIDYCIMRRKKDLVTGLCLLLAEFFPLSLVWMHPRGLSVLPVAVASFIFYCAHMRIAAIRAFKALLEGGRIPRHQR